ncbi:NAD(P)-binding protein [Flavobacterium magnum]|uniref:NAD(P)-binding protein n=1 Tax=Flavobacterium magnum TaxID=2162713 RepID=UPI001FE8A7C5|nr:NAD(P)-binding protein [Flavobacterium magnum]
MGGGVTGLSAARQFRKNGIDDFLLLELEHHLGGNASNGENKYSKFPLGAHYLPLPNFNDKKLLQFLEEENIITGYDTAGLPVFDETQLTFSPQERLFYNNSWQEGLVPKNLNQAEHNDFDTFFKKMDGYMSAKGTDAKFLFDIPIQMSSSDAVIRDFDKISMKEWLLQNRLVSETLHSYIDYCCRDDFGLGIDYVSAWAGIHYFAGRKHDSTSDKKENVLTWPEGNARLANHLKKYVQGKNLPGHLVYDVKIAGDAVAVKAFDNVGKKSILVVAEKVLMASPQFVNQYLFEGRKPLASKFHYAPWLLATLTVRDLVDNQSHPLSWDNVIHGSKGLGYVYDQHQSLAQTEVRKVITYYYCFSGPDLRKLRKEVYSGTNEKWKKLVFDDLKIAHPDIEDQTEHIDIHLLGHGMISPIPGFIFGDAKAQAAKPIGNRVFFAHSDLSGISIFEEAFHQGINVVNQMTHAATLDS